MTDMRQREIVDTLSASISKAVLEASFSGLDESDLIGALKPIGEALKECKGECGRLTRAKLEKAIKKAVPTWGDRRYLGKDDRPRDTPVKAALRFQARFLRWLQTMKGIGFVDAHLPTDGQGQSIFELHFLETDTRQASPLFYVAICTEPPVGE